MADPQEHGNVVVVHITQRVTYQMKVVFHVNSILSSFQCSLYPKFVFDEMKPQ